MDLFVVYKNVSFGGHANAAELISAIQGTNCRIRAKGMAMLKEWLHNFIHYERTESLLLIRVSALGMKKKSVTHAQLVNRIRKKGFKEAPLETVFYFQLQNKGFLCGEIKVLSGLLPHESKNYLFTITDKQPIRRREKYSIETFEATPKTEYLTTDWILVSC